MIYIRLLNEGSDAWAPAPARRVGGSVFEVLRPSDYHPQAEVWEFVPGTMVECEERIRGSHRVLLAVRRAGPSPRGPVSPRQQ